MKWILILCFSSVAFGQDYFGVKFLDNWTTDSVLAGAGQTKFSDVWGFKYNNDNYAVIGSTFGSHFLKIEDNKLSQVDFHFGAFASILAQHRDFTSYKNYVYAVGDEGPASLQIFDISYLPDSVHKVYDSDLHFSICHNIFIDSAKAKLYACGANGTGMKILDITDPVNPQLSLDFIGVNYVHDCYVVNDTAFLNAANEGLHIYDFGGNTPIQLGVLEIYQEQGYNHSGWLSENQKEYCFIDETLGKKIKYCDLSDGIENVKVSELFGTANAKTTIPHNIIISNGLAFVSNYKEGLRIFDITNKPIKEVAHYDTFLKDLDYDFGGAWGVYIFEEDNLILVSDRQSGLFLLDFPVKTFLQSARDANQVSTPFINTESLILFQTDKKETYTFSIYNILGQIIYEKSEFSSWINVPLSLGAGAYVYGIYNQLGERIDSGKFIIL